MSTFDRVAPPLIENCRYHLDKRCQSRIARGCRYSSGKRYVVQKKLLRILKGDEHLSNLFGHCRQLLSSLELGRQSNRPNFKKRSGFKHLFVTKAVELG